MSSPVPIFGFNPNGDPSSITTLVLGRNYFDNVAGDDTTGDGTLENPWKTIEKALDDGLIPGWITTGIDNGPTNPYRINENNNYYLQNKFGSVTAPIQLVGDPNSQAYLRKDPDRPLNPYANIYISGTVVSTGWVLSAQYSGVWEVDNTVSGELILYGCSEAVWNADGVVGMVRGLDIDWRDEDGADNLLDGEYYITGPKIFYRPNAGEVLSTHHFEIAKKKSAFDMKRIKYMSFEGLSVIGVGGTGFTTDGRGVNREIDGELMDDWCSNITLKNSYMKYCKLATSFTCGEYYTIENCVATDNMNGGFGFYGNDGDWPSSDRGFPVSHTLIKNSKVARCRANDGIVWHHNGPYTDTNAVPSRIRQDGIGHTHRVINCTSADNGENGFDITAGRGFILQGCVTNDNEHAGITLAHYVRDVEIYDHLSINDDTDRNFGGGLGIGDSRNVLVDNMTVYNPGYRFITIKGDAQGIEIRNSRFVAGPDTVKSDVIVFTKATAGEFSTVPRVGSTAVTQTPTSSDMGTGIMTTPPQQFKDINIHNNVFDIAFGEIDDNATNHKFKLFVNFTVLPVLGYNVKFESNVWKTSVLNTQFQPAQAPDPLISDSGPYKAANSNEAQGSAGGFQPDIDVKSYQSYFAAGDFTQYSGIWDWYNGTPRGRETLKLGGNYEVPFDPPVYNTSTGFTSNDTVEDLTLYTSAHFLPPEVSPWDEITVIGDANSTFDYWEKTNWTIASPSALGTSRACAYSDVGFENVSAQCPWSGDHRTSAGPMVCINVGRPEFGLSLVWYAGAANNASYLTLVEVGQNNQRNIVGFSAPYPHSDGTEVRLRINVANGVLRCYAGVAPVWKSTITVDNNHELSLIPMTTTEGGSVFSDTYNVSTNNPNLDNSTTHGVYLFNNEPEGSRTASLEYARYPDYLRELKEIELQ